MDHLKKRGYNLWFLSTLETSHEKFSGGIDFGCEYDEDASNYGHLRELILMVLASYNVLLCAVLFATVVRSNQLIKRVTI